MKPALQLTAHDLTFDTKRVDRLLVDSAWLDTKGLSLGQHRVQNAFELFSKAPCNGQHLFLLSYPSIDSKGLINELLATYPHSGEFVYDVVYVDNLAAPAQPICLQLPKGQGVKFTRLVTSWLKNNASADQAAVAGSYTLNVEQLLKVFKHLPDVLSYLVDLAKRLDNGAKLSHPLIANNFINHTSNNQFPFLYCDNPNTVKLFGDIAMVTEQGSTVANHHLLQPGLLHQANGGVLILPAERLLESPHLWFELKSALLDGQIQWVNANAWLNPQPVKLKLQIVLTGDAQSYKEFLEIDPDLTKFFPIIAEVDHQFEITSDQHLTDYAGYLLNIARRSNCDDLTPTAVSRLMSLSSFMIEHKSKLSLDSATFTQLIQQAQTHTDGQGFIDEKQIELAIVAYNLRKNRIATYSFDAIRERQLLIETHGTKVGQINGLSVLETDLDSFGEPSRITAAVYIGNGEVADVERKVELAGNIHAKGVAILTSFLHQKFAYEEDMPLSANLVFEQSYQGIDGDSAAMASLICLLSAFSKCKLRQGIAVTGAIDQFGNVLAVGGINEKIEGYFKTCVFNTLDGNQGVIIPQSNMINLNLSPEVIEQIDAGNFVIHAISHVDQAVEICFAMTAGKPNSDLLFPEKSLYGVIQQRIESIHNPIHPSFSLFDKLKQWLN